jgi:hypothetical protein
MIASTQTVRIALTLSLALAIAAEAASRAAGQQTSSRQRFAASAGNSSRQPVSSRNSFPSVVPPQATGSGANGIYDTLDSPGTAGSDSASGNFDIARDGKPLTPELTELGEKIRECLATYEPKHLNAKDNSCWEVMHSLIAFGPRTEIFRDGPGGQTVNAMGWLCWGGRCQGQPLIVLENNAPHALYGVGLEGHGGQYLAMMAQWRVRPNSPMHIGGRDFTVADYIEEEKATCQSGTELTFKLLALSHYLPSDAQWVSRNGERWNIPKLLKAELEAPVHGAACGGTHRLFAIDTALKERAKRGEPIDGQYVRAAKYIYDYQRYTLGSLQNPDGSFSTEWFNYPADRANDIDRKIQTTGHMLEFLVWSLPPEQLRDPRLIKAVDFISSLMLANPDRPWSIGPMGHALHAQMIYHERMFNESPLPAVPLTAAVPMPTKPKSGDLSVNPSEPECEKRPEMTIEQLQNTSVNPLLPSDASHQTAGEESDGCVESIPGTAGNPPTRMANKEAPSTLAPAPPTDDGEKKPGPTLRR